MTIKIENFQNWISKIKGLSNQTIRVYSNYLITYISNYPDGKLSQINVNDFLLKYNPRNNVVRAFLRMFIIYYKSNKDIILEEGQNLDEINAIFIPNITGRKEKKIPETFTKNEILRIESYMPEERYKLMLLISFYCGLRIQELMRIKIQDIKIDEFLDKFNALKDDPDKDSKRSQILGEILVFGKGNKQGICYLKCEVMIRLIEYINNNISIIGYETIWRIKQNTWRNVLKEATKKALNREINAHQLRHSLGTHLINNDVELVIIRDALRHKEISSTEIYAHLNKEKVKKSLLSNT